MAGLQIASLFASIGVDAKPLEKGLGGAKQSLQQFGGEMSKQVVGTIGLAAAVYKAGQAVVDSVRDWADYADGMRLSAQMAGVTTEEMSRLSQAADDFRVPMETMQRSMEMALKNGFAPTIDNIADLSDKLIGISDPAARAAAASKIFGKSYADMMPFLLAGGDAIRSATTNIDANLVVTEEAARQAKKYKDELDNLGDTWTGLKNVLGKFLVPVATNIFSTLSDDLVEFAGHVSYLFTVMDYWGTKPFNFDNVAGFTNDMMAFFTSPLITEDPAKFMELLQIRIAEMNDEMGRTAGAATPAADGLASVGAAASANMTILNAIDLSGAREEYLATAATLREDLAGAYADVADAEDNWRSGVGGSIKTQLDTQFDGGVIGAEEYLTKLQLIDDQFGTDYVLKYKMELEVDDLFKTLMENPEEFANKASAFEDYFMPLDESVGAAMDQVSNLQMQLIELERTYYATVKVSIDNGGTGTLSGLPSLPSRGPIPHASGGYAMADTPYIVGERGPELFVPNANGQVVANNELGGGNSELLGDILLELQNQPSRIKVAIKEAMALVGG